MSIVPQYFEIRAVGKTIKSSKKQYVWRFKLENKEFTIELFTSMLSGKRKILQNGQTLFFDSKHQSAFQFPFNIGRNSLVVVQHGDKYELRINNQSFTHLYEQEKTKRNFTYENREQNDPYKAKHYAQNYETSTKQTSRDIENSMKNQDGFIGEPVEIQQLGQGYHQEEVKVVKPISQANQQSKVQKQKDVSYNAYDFSTGFDHGFEKFGTYVPDPNEQKKNSSASSKPQIPKESAGRKTEKQQSKEFFFEESYQTNYNNNDFDFENYNNGTSLQKPQKQEPIQNKNNIVTPVQQQETSIKKGNELIDLDDLLGGGNQNSSDQKQSQLNALDFFQQNDIAFNNSQPKQSEIQQNDQQKVNDIFGISGPQQSNPISNTVQNGNNVQEIQPPQSDKPKFMPNLGGFYGGNPQQNMYQTQQQQAMLQQQMMMQQMMMMNQQQPYQTGMNPNMMMGNNPQSNFQSQYGGNQYMTGMMPQNQNQTMQTQQQNYNQGGQQQQQNNFNQVQNQMNNNVQQVPVNSSSGSSGTPFDMFS